MRPSTALALLSVLVPVMAHSQTDPVVSNAKLLLSRIDHLEEIQQGILKYLEGQKRIADAGSPGSSDAMQPQIDVLRPFLRINHPNYPNYARYFIWGLISGVLLAMVLTPILGKKNAKSQP